MEDQTKCVFCKIITGKLFAAKLYEDEEVMAFVDIMPVNPGHSLVIPKTHSTLVADLPESTFLKLFKIGRDIQEKIGKAFPETTAFNFFIADGKDAGQEVPHVHLHILPRKPNDGFGIKFGQNYGRMLSEEERREIAMKILSL